jgi:hypothetical protein
MSLKAEWSIIDLMYWLPLHIVMPRIVACMCNFGILLRPR